jgi:hypothetical protein
LISVSYPGLVFSIFSSLFGCIGLVLWLIGIVQILNSTLQDTIVFSALGLLYISLAIILQLWGLIADFTCRTGNIRSDQFAAYTLRNYNSMN